MFCTLVVASYSRFATHNKPLAVESETNVSTRLSPREGWGAVRRGVYTLGGLCVLVVVALLVAPAVAADSTDTQTDSEPTYQIVQGEQVIPVEPIDGDEPVEAFYDYRNPEVGDRDHPYWGRSFSSEGTVEYQADDTSILMLYDGPDGVSLVAVHDQYHEDQDDATTGGSVSWELNGLPEDGEWAVIDDNYGWLTDDEEQDDIIYLDEDHRAGAAGNDGEPPHGADAMLSWVWLTGRTDGMAFRGIGTEPSITIEPAFNEDSYHRYGDQRRADDPPDRPGMGERYNGTIDDWQVIVPNGDDDFERVSIESLDEPIEVRSTESEPDRAIPELTVESVTLAESTIAPDEQAEITVVVENRGAVDGSYPVRLSVAGTELQRETVDVDAGDQQTVTFSQPFATPGVYELSVNSQQVSLTVEESDTNAADTESEVESQADTETDQTTGESTTESEDDTPGFGVVSAVVGLIVAVAAVRHRNA